MSNFGDFLQTAQNPKFLLKKVFACDGEEKVAHLRPETAESLYYMWYYTGDEKFQMYGYEIFRAIKAFTKAPYGFSSVSWQNLNAQASRGVHSQVQLLDIQESFFPAETLKYLYLLFKPRRCFSLEDFVFNTEGHPLRRYKEKKYGFLNILLEAWSSEPTWVFVQYFQMCEKKGTVLGCMRLRMI